MKRMNIKIVLLICLLFIATSFIFYNDLSLAKDSNENEVVEANKIANEIMERIDETKLSIQIEKELKKNGYSPHGLIAYQIYSPDEQYVIISMEKINQKNQDIKNDIQKIVNAVSKANNFNSFIVDIQTVK